MMARRCFLALTLLLVACGEPDRASDKRAERDPEIAAALNDPIMTDPDLASQNRGNSALQGGGPASAPLPPERTGPGEVEQARAAALDWAGGRLATPPAPGEPSDVSRLAGKLTAQAIADALPALSQGCGKLDYGFVWAARLPAAVPVYPRGHARQAAGSDTGGCGLRVVVFVTAVAPVDVQAFYATAAGKAGMALEARREGADEVLSGTSKSLGFAVFARPAGKDLTEVVLVTRER